MFMMRVVVLMFCCLCTGSVALAQGGSETRVRANAPIYIRAAPPDGTTPLRVAAVGTTLRVLAQEGEWLNVEFNDPRWGIRRGWIHATFTDFADAALTPMDLSVREPADPAPPRAYTPQPPEPSSAPYISTTGIDQGTTELMVTASIIGTSAGGDTAVVSSVDTSVGFFVTSQLEFGGAFTMRKVEDFDAVGTASGFVAYNVNPASQVIGFLGGAVGSTFGTGDIHPLALQVFGGVRVLTPGGGGALIIRPFYERDVFFDEFIEDSNTFGVALGVSLLF
jgi:hypothetical protein